MKIPELKPVTSSNIEAIGYDVESTTLFIKFIKGIIYSYSGVSQLIYRYLMNASSVGKYFRDNIEGKYTSKVVKS
jgi:hypothetical protein